MDWINEKLKLMKVKIENLPLWRALVLYLLTMVLAGSVCSWVTDIFCERWISMIYGRNAQITEQVFYVRGEFHLVYPRSAIEEMPEQDKNMVAALDAVMEISPFLYMGIFTILAAMRFYHVRLKRPFEILKMGTEEIKQNNLDFEIYYSNEDEMGELCASFENMRRELIANKEELWNVIEEQKKINAAFAHDLRTPLTVLKGYTDFLYRYIPEGKVSEEKLTGTLRLMSQHLERLTVYSSTMKNIRSFEEMQPQKTEITLARLRSRLSETAGALDRIGDIRIRFTDTQTANDEMGNCMLWIDEIMVMEVFDNLLSNAIRFARSRIVISLEADTQKGILYLYVRDDGPGFTEEELKIAALPYFHGEEQKEEHFGIGLYITQQLCHKHGGALSLANSIGGGALVSVSFSFQNS